MNSKPSETTPNILLNSQRFHQQIHANGVHGSKLQLVVGEMPMGPHMTQFINSQDVSHGSKEPQHPHLNHSVRQEHYKDPMSTTTHGHVPGAPYSPNNQVVTYTFDEPPVNYKALPMPHGSRRSFDDNLIHQLENTIYQFAEDLAKKHGMRLQLVNARNVDDRVIDFNFSMSLVNPMGVDSLGIDFLRYIDEHELPPHYYMHRFLHDNIEYMITGYDRAKKTVRLACADGERQMALESLKNLIMKNVGP